MTGIRAWLAAKLAMPAGAFVASTVVTTGVALGVAGALGRVGPAAPPEEPRYAERLLDERCRDPAACPLPGGLREACGCDPREQALFAKTCELPRKQAVRVLECEAMGLTGDETSLGVCMRGVDPLGPNDLGAIPWALGTADRKSWTECAATWAGGVKTGEKVPDRPPPGEPLVPGRPEPKETPCIETRDYAACLEEAEFYLREAPEVPPHPKLADRFATFCQPNDKYAFCAAAALVLLEQEQPDHASAQGLLRRACQILTDYPCLYLGLQHAANRSLNAQEFRGSGAYAADQCKAWKVDHDVCDPLAAEALSYASERRIISSIPNLAYYYYNCIVKRAAFDSEFCETFVKLSSDPPSDDLTKGRQELVHFYQALYREGACNAGLDAVCEE